MWEALSRDELDALVARELADCSEELRNFYSTTSVAPEKWAQHPYGDQGGGFWAIAVFEQKVLWYNDIEDGFNVSAFTTHGRIPDDGYRCQQDEIALGLQNLRDS